MKDVPDAEPLYRLITSILDYEQASVKELPCITNGGKSGPRWTS